MSKNEKSLLKSFLLFVLIVAIGVAGTVLYQHRSSPNAEASSGMVPTPTQPQAQKIPNTVSESSVHSSKADKNLVLRTTKYPDGSARYTYEIDQRVLFEKTLPAGASMALPFNSWDPTDTYVFVEEHNSGAVNYLVFQANGQPFADGNTYIDVESVWANKQIGYKIRTATGWASGTLLIIYTSKDDGSRGPAFWFEIPSAAILQLAS